MPNKIDGTGGAGVQPSRTTGPSEASKEQREASQPTAPRDAEQVQFTDSARLLQRLESELRVRPEVDESRVAELKERIDTGRFDLDPHRIAKRLIKTEQDL